MAVAQIRPRGLPSRRLQILSVVSTSVIVVMPGMHLFLRSAECARADVVPLPTAGASGEAGRTREVVAGDRATATSTAGNVVIYYRTDAASRPRRIRPRSCEGRSTNAWLQRRRLSPGRRSLIRERTGRQVTLKPTLTSKIGASSLHLWLPRPE